MRRLESRTGGYRDVIPRAALMIIAIVSYHLDEDPEIVIFPSSMESPWVCFDVGRRRFGIWKRTLKLYEADEDGAMDEEPIDPGDVKP
jgi:hypothetical protein